jgi:hypothetical protein
MEKWRRVWREGIASLLSNEALLALRAALRDDDPLLLQGATCYPPLLDLLRDRPIESACALGWCGWKGEGLDSVLQVEAFFTRLCDAVDEAFQETGASRYFLNWYDETPRARMRGELLAEVERTLQTSVRTAA